MHTRQEPGTAPVDTTGGAGHNAGKQGVSQAASIMVADRVAQAGRSTTEAAKLAHRVGGPPVAVLAQRMTTQRDAVPSAKGSHMRGTRIG